MVKVVKINHNTKRVRSALDTVLRGDSFGWDDNDFKEAVSYHRYFITVEFEDDEDDEKECVACCKDLKKMMLHLLKGTNTTITYY